MDVLFKLGLINDIQPKNYYFSIYFYGHSFEYYIYKDRKCRSQGNCEKLEDAINEIEDYYNNINLKNN